ncbi:GlmU family protein [Candidatus Korarchaeum cryptofilum]|uniref:GlmU family protein n=1 Tax=Candidatus Korarchaeum cryptofilum TaxID=498846 RepID=UPI00163CF964|nr:GlmU family protein [Candidatus Korarchaeum cryptofilum]
MQLVIFEDRGVEALSPITDLIPMQEVVVGGAKQFIRLEKLLDMESRWIVRDHMELRVPESRKPDYGSPAIILNSRLLSTDLSLKLDYGEALICGSQVVAAKVRSLEWPPEFERAKPCEAKLLENLWDICPTSIVEHLRSDLMKLYGGSEIRVNVNVVGRHAVVIGEGVDILGPLTIDAREGPVIIEKDVLLEPYSYLKGPLYVGAGSQIVAGSRVAGSYLGTATRVGGEVTTSVISDYSNKYHLGFLGHSYVGRWVNIGAGSITSNLKNTYGEVKVRGASTGLSKIGAFIGDHAKLSIGTLTYAGTVIGTASHVHGLVREEVPPFTIYGRSLGWEPVEIELDSVIRTYRRMAPRRNLEPDPREEKLLELLFERTEDLRRRMGVRKGRLG